jgi:cytochrome c
MSDDLKWNKIFGAGLATALVILGVREVSTRLYETEPPEKMGYAIEVADEPDPSGAAADTLPDWGTMLNTADLKAGEGAFAKCKSCHEIAQGGANKTGPGLWGVVGRPTASHAGFAYSDAMKAHAAAAPNWTYDELYNFLGKPGKWVPGTKMSFAGIKAKEDRVNLIAYLRSQGSAGYAIPAPDPSRQPGAAAAAAAPAGAVGTTPATATAAGQGPTPTGGAGGPAGQAPLTNAPLQQQASPAGSEGPTSPAERKH